MVKYISAIICIKNILRYHFNRFQDKKFAWLTIFLNELNTLNALFKKDLTLYTERTDSEFGTTEFGTTVLLEVFFSIEEITLIC